MRKFGFFVLIMAILLGASLMSGCSPLNNNSNADNIPDSNPPNPTDHMENKRAEDINSMDLNDVDRLPDEMKEDPLNKTLEEMRDSRRKHYSTKDGSQVKASMKDTDLPGQTKSRPKFNYDELYDIMSVIEDYVVNVAKVPKRGYGYDYDQCIDPRMNAIYDDEDKGVAKGYTNKDIFVAEYETAKDGVYSYLLLARDSKEGSWKIIYDGLNYKQE